MWEISEVKLTLQLWTWQYLWLQNGNFVKELHYWRILKNILFWNRIKNNITFSRVILNRRSCLWPSGCFWKRHNLKCDFPTKISIKSVFRLKEEWSGVIRLKRYKISFVYNDVIVSSLCYKLVICTNNQETPSSLRSPSH